MTAEPDPRSQPVENALFPRTAATPTAQDAQTILELYKLYVGTMEALVARRQATHTFFLTASSFLLTVAGVLLGKDYVEAGVAAAPVVLAALAGIFLCLVWMSLSLGYQRFNEKKFEVIHAFERRLPAEPFRAEWIALGEGRKPGIYGPMAAIERLVPILFLFLYVVLFVIGLVAFLR